MSALKSLFLLDPEIHFLNHGSFGAVPQPVFSVWQDWQRRLERQPVRFFIGEYHKLLRQARGRLAGALQADADDLVFVPNATFAVNLVARSILLREGDEVLSSNHEYGACENVWEFVCRKTGAHFLRQPLPLEGDEETLAEHFWAAVGPRTRVIFLSHISSPTARQLPIAAICRRARAAGILTLIDGAHAPGQIALDLNSIDADFYTGNLHKWFMAPKGAAFLHVRQAQQHSLEPLVISWGRQPDMPDTLASRLQWMGTDDPSAMLAVPAAIDFMAEHAWPEVRQRCHELLRDTLAAISQITGLAPAYPLACDHYHQMGIARLPSECDLARLKTRLIDDFRVEVPLIDWHGEKFVRVSIQGYNDESDSAALLDGLRRLL